MGKGIFIVAAAGMVFLAACKSGSRETAWSGVYVNTARSTYSVAEDTLRIQATADGQYRLTRSTGYRVIRDGVLLPKRFRSESFKVVADADGQELSEPLNARSYRLDATGDLLVGRVVYRRVN